MIETLTQSRLIIILLILAVALALHAIANSLSKIVRLTTKIHDMHELDVRDLTYMGEVSFSYDINNRIWYKDCEQVIDIFNDTINQHLSDLGIAQEYVKRILDTTYKEATSNTTRRNAYRVITFQITKQSKEFFMVNIILINM